MIDITLGDLIAAAAPMALMLWMLRRMSGLETSMAGLLERFKSIEARLEKQEKSQHDQNNRIQELTNRITLLEFRAEYRKDI